MNSWIVTRRALVALLGLALLGGPAGAGERALSPLVIETVDGAKHFQVEVAETPDDRRRGLMFRRKLAKDTGMVFDFRRDQMVSMWMKNTLIPLDMVFIDRQGRVVRIHARAIPGSLASISSGKPVRAVLELSGGSTARHGIKAGDLVRHRIFNNLD